MISDSNYQRLSSFDVTPPTAEEILEQVIDDGRFCCFSFLPFSRSSPSSLAKRIIATRHRVIPSDLENISRSAKRALSSTEKENFLKSVGIAKEKLYNNKLICCVAKDLVSKNVLKQEWADYIVEKLKGLDTKGVIKKLHGMYLLQPDDLRIQCFPGYLNRPSNLAIEFSAYMFRYALHKQDIKYQIVDRDFEFAYGEKASRYDIKLIDAFFSIKKTETRFAARALFSTIVRKAKQLSQSINLFPTIYRAIIGEDLFIKQIFLYILELVLEDEINNKDPLFYFVLIKRVESFSSLLSTQIKRFPKKKIVKKIKELYRRHANKCQEGRCKSHLLYLKNLQVVQNSHSSFNFGDLVMNQLLNDFMRFLKVTELKSHRNYFSDQNFDQSLNKAIAQAANIALDYNDRCPLFSEFCPGVLESIRAEAANSDPSLNRRNSVRSPGFLPNGFLFNNPFRNHLNPLLNDARLFPAGFTFVKSDKGGFIVKKEQPTHQPQGTELREPMSSMAVDEIVLHVPPPRSESSDSETTEETESIRRPVRGRRNRAERGVSPFS